MMKMTHVATALACCLAACVPPAPPQAPPAAPPAAASPTPAPSEAAVAPGIWNVDRVRCSDLLAASDEDRAAAAMFYYGYLAARAGIHIVDVSQIDAKIHRVMETCGAAPNITVPQAFRRALGRRHWHQ